jgi:hypothetical protein
MRAQIAPPVTANTNPEIVLPALLVTTDTIVIMGGPTSDLAPGVHLPIETIGEMGGTDTTGEDGMPTALAAIVQASRLKIP